MRWAQYVIGFRLLSFNAIQVAVPSEYVFFWDLPFHAATHARFEIGDEVIVRTGADQGLQGVVEAVRDIDIVIREGEFFPVSMLDCYHQVLLNDTHTASV